ncbi:MAG: PIN domain-containing protein [candidate division WS1 bacterium]|nr:PIN domain-containing protein [candidate division WS1 bacterium]
MSAHIYIDTSFIYALADEGDPKHSRATRIHDDCLDLLCLSTHVVGEAMSLLTKRFSKSIALDIGRGLVEEEKVWVITPSDQDFADAWALFTRYPDWDLDLIDSISFALMHREGIEQALTFDSHFAQMGFTALPG